MKRFTLRIESAIYEKLKLIALRNRRSLNSEIAFILSEYTLLFQNGQGNGQGGEKPENANRFSDETLIFKINNSYNEKE
jgi:hypothetical protein